MRIVALLLILGGTFVSVWGLPTIPHSCRAAKCRCTATGGSHFKTYDGQTIDFQSSCRYTLSQSTTSDDECTFNVEVVNDKKIDGSWRKIIVINIHDLEIALLPGLVVTINRELRELPFCAGDHQLLVSLVAEKIQVNTECGLGLSFDGNQDVIIEVPSSYSNQMTGLCGDCDGEKNDLRTRSGADLSYLAESGLKTDNGGENSKTSGQNIIYLQIADSYRKVTKNSTEECIFPYTPRTCDNATLAKYVCTSYCGLIIDDTGPFKECIKSGLVEIEVYFENCRQDLCDNEDAGEEKTQQIVCAALTSFTAVCNAAGYKVVWRKEHFCSMKCGENKEYSAMVGACPATCGHASPEEYCEKPGKEGCHCKEGLVLNDRQCTKEDECGCVDDDNVYLQLNESRITNDCLKTVLCVWNDELGQGEAKTVSTGAPCDSNAVCKVVDSERKCVCKEGFKGDGVTCTLPKTTTTEGAPTTCEEKVDILVIIDTSSTESSEVGKDFIQELIANLNIGQDKTRLALMTFNSKPKVEFNFNKYDSPEGMETAIDELETSEGYVIESALEKARTDVFTQAREGAAKIAVVITDGKLADPQKTTDQAMLLRDLGVIVFCVGTEKATWKSLKTISSYPDVTFTMQNLSPTSMESIKSAGKQAYCGPPPASEPKADIAIIMDPSKSFEQKNWAALIAFVQNLVKSLEIGPNKVRLAMVSYERGAIIEFNLDTYDNKDDMSKVIGNMSKSIVGTYIAPELKLARTDVFSKSRADAVKLAIVVTDGRSATPDQTEKEAENLRNSGVSVFCIGVGEEIIKILNDIASDPDDYHTFLSATYNFRNRLSESVLPGVMRPLCELKADIVIIMDSSKSIDDDSFKDMKNFVKDIVTAFEINPHRVRTEVLTFNSKAKVQISFEQNQNTSQIILAIDAITETNEGTFINGALELARKSFEGAREGVPKLAIVLTDGNCTTPEETKNEAKLLRDSGVSVYSIGVGSAIIDSLNIISSDPNQDFSFVSGDFEALERIKSEARRASCDSGGTDNED